MDITAPANWATVDGGFSWEGTYWEIAKNPWPEGGVFTYGGADIATPFSVIIEFELLDTSANWFEFGLQESDGGSTYWATDDDSPLNFGYIATGVRYQHTLTSSDLGRVFKAIKILPKYPQTRIHSITTSTVDNFFWTNFRGQRELL